MTSSKQRHDPLGLELIGVSIHSAPIRVLENFALNADEVNRVYDSIRSRWARANALIVSTCNRTEVYAHTGDAEAITDALGEVLRDVAGNERFPDKSHVYRLRGRAALRHLFKVSCGLDSLVLGEAQILGQLKAAYEASRDFFGPSAAFDKVVESAFRVAGRSRTETNIGAGQVSVASAGVHLTTRIFSDLHKLKVVVVGAGDTGRLVAEHFAKRRPGSLHVLNRSLNRAEDVAASVGGQAHSLDELPSILPKADIIACAIRGTSHLLSRSDIENATGSRLWPLVILDLGLPRNVAADVNELQNVFVHDIEALKHVVDANLNQRADDVPKVEELIEDELNKLEQWRRSIRAGPLIAALRSSVEDIRRAEVERVSKQLPSADREAVDRVTKALANKLLHGPIVAIKTQAEQAEQGADLVALVREMFKNLPMGDDDSDT